MILQASNCNAQIPAKMYEYLRASRPVLVLTDPTGDTAGVARHAGIESIAALDSSDEIFSLLVRFLDGEPIGMPSSDAVGGASRRARTIELAKILDEVADGH